MFTLSGDSHVGFVGPPVIRILVVADDDVGIGEALVTTEGAELAEEVVGRVVETGALVSAGP